MAVNVVSEEKKYKDLSLDVQYQVTGPLASRSILIKAQVSAAIQAEKNFSTLKQTLNHNQNVCERMYR